MSVSINGKLLKPGEDFLVDPGSPGVSGKFNVEVLNAEDLLKDDWIEKVKIASSKFIVINPYDKTKYAANQIKRLNEIIDFLKYSNENPTKGTVCANHRKINLEWFSRSIF